MATTLATIADLERRTTVPLTERALAVLEDVSAAVRNYTGQTLTAVTADTIRLRVHGQRVSLPQRPVTDVSAVTGTAGTAVTYSWDGLEIVNLALAGVVNWFETTTTTPPTVVDVTYDHGYDSVPDDIVSVVCNVAARALSAGPEMAGVMQETITSYSVSYGPIGSTGPLGFFQGETRVLDRYRRAGVVWA